MSPQEQLSDAPVMVIKGASSGIGEATARQAREAGFRLVLPARRAELITTLAESLRLYLDGTGVRVCLLNPGLTDSPIVPPSGYEVPEWALAADGLARAVMFAVTQPARVHNNEIVVRPTAQDA